MIEKLKNNMSYCYQLLINYIVIYIGNLFIDPITKKPYWA